MKMKTGVLFGIGLVTIAIGTAYGIDKNPRTNEITNYAPGHTHQLGQTHGAAEHSGGTDRHGCHNGSVPYHCH